MSLKVLNSQVSPVLTLNVLISAYFLHNIGQNITQNKAFFVQFSKFEPINFTLRTNTKIWVFEHMNCS